MKTLKQAAADRLTQISQAGNFYPGERYPLVHDGIRYAVSAEDGLMTIWYKFDNKVDVPIERCGHEFRLPVSKWTSRDRKRAAAMVLILLALLAMCFAGCSGCADPSGHRLDPELIIEEKEPVDTAKNYIEMANENKMIFDSCVRWMQIQKDYELSYLEDFNEVMGGSVYHEIHVVYMDSMKISVVQKMRQQMLYPTYEMQFSSPNLDFLIDRIKRAQSLDMRIIRGNGIITVIGVSYEMLKP